MATLGDLLAESRKGLRVDARQTLVKQRKQHLRIQDRLLKKERELRRELEDLLVLQRTIDQKLLRLGVLPNSNRTEIETVSDAQLDAWLNGHE